MPFIRSLVFENNHALPFGSTSNPKVIPPLQMDTVLPVCHPNFFTEYKWQCSKGSGHLTIKAPLSPTLTVLNKLRRKTKAGSSAELSSTPPSRGHTLAAGPATALPPPSPRCTEAHRATHATATRATRATAPALPATAAGGAAAQYVPARCNSHRPPQPPERTGRENRATRPAQWLSTVAGRVPHQGEGRGSAERQGRARHRPLPAGGSGWRPARGRPPSSRRRPSASPCSRGGRRAAHNTDLRNHCPRT